MTRGTKRHLMSAGVVAILIAVVVASLRQTLGLAPPAEPAEAAVPATTGSVAKRAPAPAVTVTAVLRQPGFSKSICVYGQVFWAVRSQHVCKVGDGPRGIDLTHASHSPLRMVQPPVNPREISVSVGMRGGACSPLSTGLGIKFPDYRESTGNLADSALFQAFLIRLSPRRSKACGWIPCASEQGIISPQQGI
jgi:hypothetical protein